MYTTLMLPQSPLPTKQHGLFRTGGEISVVCVSGRYRVGRLLGSGTFGSVYSGKDIRTGKEVALKVEYSKGFDSKLCREYKIYKDVIGGPGIPVARWCGVEGPYNVMVIDRFELSLEDLVNRQGPLDLQTALFFAHQMLSTLEFLHSRNYIHRDIKPDNFMVGANNNVHISH
ncbi:kinase-like domain-containing protein [Amanita rubescens]|nr:kinase-like domain-containing protein [Amanita rubescens]